MPDMDYGAKSAIERSVMEAGVDACRINAERIEQISVRLMNVVNRLQGPRPETATLRSPDEPSERDFAGLLDRWNSATKRTGTTLDRVIATIEEIDRLI